MPQYCYKCGKCDIEFDTWHPITERLEDCPCCNLEGALFRVPYFVFNSEVGQEQTGETVKRAIKEAKAEIEEEKRKISEKDYEHDKS